MQPSQFFHVLAVLFSSRQVPRSPGRGDRQCCRKSAGKRVHAYLGKMTTPEARVYRARAGDLIQQQMAEFAPGRHSADTEKKSCHATR